MFSIKRALVIGTMLSAVLAVNAFASQTTVSLVTLTGARALTVKSMTGDDLTALAMGSGREAGFLVNVSDLAYDRRGYQVTAMMSNLYKFNGSSYECDATSIPSSKLSIGFLANPNSVRDVAASAAPVLTFAGSISNIANAALLTSLGLPLTASAPVSTSVTEQLQDFVTNTVFSGLENALPIKVSSLEGGPFSSPSPQLNCDPSASGATSIQIQQGTVNDSADLLAWVQSTSNGIYNAAAGPDGVLSAAEAVSGGLVSQSALDDAVRTALTSAPLSVNPLAITSAVLSSIETLLSAPSATVSSILRQTGSYSSLPKLVVGDLSGIPTGLYKGTMTITLIEE